MNTDFIQIASYASKAPSGHNTQPWKFHITDNTITVIPNFEVALPVVDGNNRELFISLGCAVENVCIAANHFGYTTQIAQCSIKGIILELTKNDLTIENPLFHQIEKRQTNRSVYNGNKVSDEMLQQLQSIQKEEAVQFYFELHHRAIAVVQADAPVLGHIPAEYGAHVEQLAVQGIAVFLGNAQALAVHLSLKVGVLPGQGIGGAAGDLAHALDEPVVVPLGLADDQAQHRHQRHGKDQRRRPQGVEPPPGLLLPYRIVKTHIAPPILRAPTCPAPATLPDRCHTYSWSRPPPGTR